MAVEKHEGGTTFTGDHVRVYAIHAKLTRLALACHFGPARGELEAARKMCGSSARVTKKVLEDYVIWMYKEGLTLDRQWLTVERGLGITRAKNLRRKCESLGG